MIVSGAQIRVNMTSNFIGTCKIKVIGNFVDKYKDIQLIGD